MAEINTSIQLDVKSVIVIVFVVVKNIYFGFKKEKKKEKKKKKRTFQLMFFKTLTSNVDTQYEN